MVEGVEERLARLEKELKSQKKLEPKKRVKISRYKITVAALVMILSGSLITWKVFIDIKAPASPFPTSIQKMVNFSLYYPTQLPEGLSVDTSSMSATSQAVTYVITQESGPSFFVSLQRFPENFDFNAFKRKFQDNDNFETPTGSVFIGDAGNGLIASIRTNDGTWILINTADYTAMGLTANLCRAFQSVPK